jgi:hypothetical protein
VMDQGDNEGLTTQSSLAKVEAHEISVATETNRTQHLIAAPAANLRQPRRTPSTF